VPPTLRGRLCDALPILHVVCDVDVDGQERSRRRSCAPDLDVRVPGRRGGARCRVDSRVCSELLWRDAELPGDVDAEIQSWGHSPTRLGAHAMRAGSLRHEVDVSRLHSRVLVDRDLSSEEDGVGRLRIHGRESHAATDHFVEAVQTCHLVPAVGLVPAVLGRVGVVDTKVVDRANCPRSGDVAVDSDQRVPLESRESRVRDDRTRAPRDDKCARVVCTLSERLAALLGVVVVLVRWLSALRGKLRALLFA
jgi:hypothetical protein